MEVIQTLPPVTQAKVVVALAQLSSHPVAKEVVPVVVQLASAVQTGQLPAAQFARAVVALNQLATQLPAKTVAVMMEVIQMLPPVTQAKVVVAMAQLSSHPEVAKVLVPMMAVFSQALQSGQLQPVSVARTLIGLQQIVVNLGAATVVAVVKAVQTLPPAVQARIIQTVAALSAQLSQLPPAQLPKVLQALQHIFISIRPVTADALLQRLVALSPDRLSQVLMLLSRIPVDRLPDALTAILEQMGHMGPAEEGIAGASPKMQWDATSRHGTMTMRMGDVIAVPTKNQGTSVVLEAVAGSLAESDEQQRKWLKLHRQSVNGMIAQLKKDDALSQILMLLMGTHDLLWEETLPS